MSIVVIFGLILIAIALFMAIYNLKTGLIPHFLAPTIFASYFAYAILSGQPIEDMLYGFLLALSILVIGFVLYVMRIGLGPAIWKVIAGVSPWLGLSEHLLFFFISMFFTGGVIALIVIALQKLEVVKEDIVPYGPAIAVGMLTTIPAIQQVWTVLSLG